MAARVPESAYAVYVRLGRDRSYEKVAEILGVSTRSIVRIAQKENWRERVAEIDAIVRGRVDLQSLESFEDVIGRQMKIVRILQGRVLEELRAKPLPTPVAARLIIHLLREERTLRTTPTAANTQDEARELAQAFARASKTAEAFIPRYPDDVSAQKPGGRRPG